MKILNHDFQDVLISAVLISIKDSSSEDDSSLPIAGVEKNVIGRSTTVA